MARKSQRDMLAGVSLFEGLSRRELKDIEEMGREVEFAPGQTIVTEEETGLGFHLILQGKARVTVRGRSRGTLGPGKFFGELSLIDRGPRTATVTAETPVKTLAIASWDFVRMLDKSPSVARKVMVELCRRLRNERSFTH